MSSIAASMASDLHTCIYLLTPDMVSAEQQHRADSHYIFIQLLCGFYIVYCFHHFLYFYFLRHLSLI